MKLEKTWFDVISPEFDNTSIGSVYGAPSGIVGRKVSIQTTKLKELKQRAGYTLTFFIYEMGEGNTAKAKIERLSLSREQLSRFVRHAIIKRDISIPVMISGNEYLIKAIFTMHKSKRRYSTEIINKIRDLLPEKLKDYDMKKLVSEIMEEKVQSDLKKELNKIYPLRAIEIRAVEPYKRKHQAT